MAPLEDGDTGLVDETSGEQVSVTDSRLDGNSLLIDLSGRRASLDPFERLRVSTPVSLFDSKQIFDDNPLFFETILTGNATGTYLNAKSATDLQTTTASGDRAIRQTKRRFNYQPGKGLICLLTFNFESADTNVRKRAGYYDDSEGIFLEQAGSSVSLVRRSSVAGSPTITVAQASWNIDPMDGTGQSGVTLDLTKVQILVIDLQWLGAGSVRVGFDIGGKIAYVHEFDAANILPVVYMRTPNLPLRWEIENTGIATGTPTLQQICGSVMVEGGIEPVGFTRSADTGITGTPINQTLEMMIAIRLKASHNRATIIPRKTTVMSSTGANFRWALVLNPTIGGTPSWQSITDSAVEFDRSANGAVSGGIVIDSGYTSNNADLTTADISSVLTLASDFNGVSDILALVAQTIGSTSEILFGSITWLEVL